MKGYPKISVITVCYNADDTIEETIKSVIGQDYSNYEYIIIDGGSNDGTVKIIEKYKYKIAFFVSERDDGIYDAMNKGFNHTTGEWVIYVNSGDGFYNNKALSNLVGNTNISNYDIVYGDAIGVDSSGKETYRKATDIIPRFREIPSFRHGAAIMKKESMPAPPFQTAKKEFGFALDTNLIFQMIHGGKRFAHINETILRYDIDGVSNNQLAQAKYDFRIFTQYGFKLVPFFQYVKSLLFQNIKKIFK